MRLISKDRAVNVPYDSSVIMIRHCNSDYYNISAVCDGKLYRLCDFHEETLAIECMEKIYNYQLTHPGATYLVVE